MIHNQVNTQGVHCSCADSVPHGNQGYTLSHSMSESKCVSNYKRCVVDAPYRYPMTIMYECTVEI